MGAEEEEEKQQHRAKKGETFYNTRKNIHLPIVSCVFGGGGCGKRDGG